MRSTEDNTTLLKLPGGLRLVHSLWRGAAVEYCGVIVRAGSRNDSQATPGMAHFVEHTIFKGTEKRSLWHINNRMERVGGELNAYTTKEETVVYTASPTGNLDRGMELLADLVCNSRFPDSELDKEREVVADEINSYLDQPAEAVFDDFEDLIFAGTPLGHNILGTVESINGFDSALCRSWLREWYSATNMAVFYCGPASPARVEACVRRRFADLPTHECRQERLPEGFNVPVFNSLRHIDSHQAHTVMGCRAPGLYDDKRHTFALLTNILGGPGMNSILNVALREKKGLVYSVDANLGLMTDCGLFTVYFGCDPDDTDKCMSYVRNEIERIAENGISERQLTAAKKQYIGQLAVASDNRENIAIGTGRTALYYDCVNTTAHRNEAINSVSATDLRQAAASLCTLSSLTLTQ